MNNVNWLILNLNKNFIFNMYSSKDETNINNIKRLINILIDSGIKITFVSNLLVHDFVNFIRDLYLPHIDSYVVGSNGIQVYNVDEKKYLKNNAIAGPFKDEFNELIHRLIFDYQNDICITIYTSNDEVYLFSNDQNLLNEKINYYEFFRKGDLSKVKTNEPLDNIDDPIMASVSIGSKESNINLIKFLKSYNDNFHYYLNDSNEIDIYYKTDVYDNPILFIKKNNEIYNLFKRDNICSIGTSEYTIELFKLSVMSITHENAQSELKKISTYICMGNENLFLYTSLKTVNEHTIKNNKQGHLAKRIRF